MVDKSAPLVLDALSRAVADPGGLPLFSGKQAPGLFAATAAAKQAAQQCKDDGLLHIVRTETFKSLKPSVRRRSHNCHNQSDDKENNVVDLTYRCSRQLSFCPGETS